MTLFDDLKERGLVHQSTDEEQLRSLLNDETVTFYLGVDPTGDSLHVGHLVALLVARRLQAAGHKPVLLMGGATGMIGDPSGRSTERNLLTPEDVQANVDALAGQIGRLIELDAEGVELVNNASWTAEVTFIDWLREVGKHFSVNYMTAKESVRRRLEDRSQGISYTEFSYMLIQANDFYELSERFGCRLQIGGSDQWGNITAGIELTRRKSGKEVYGLTFPLVTTASGEKFGKSAGNAVWLDAERTSPFEFYQYFMRSEDADVGLYLRYLSFRPMSELNELLREHEETPHRRLAQKALATELTELVHGADGLARAEMATEVLFGREIEGLNDRELAEIFADVAAVDVAREQLDSGVPLVELLDTTGLCKSRGDARRSLKQGGVYINNRRVDDADHVVTAADLASESVVVLRRGKRNYALARFK